MTSPAKTAHYALGSSDREHDRLIRQAAWLAPHTERLFRDAGIGPGQRVLDLGSGVGDVSLIVARLVGPSGAVIGIERDPRSIARAAARMAAADIGNVTFTQIDATQIAPGEPFDAVVGRYILMYLADPVSGVRSLSRLVRPGGVVAFQEPDWTDFLDASARLPLWSRGASLLIETLKRSGTDTEMGLALSRVFVGAGLLAPSMRTDTILGAEEWMPDCLVSMRPRIAELGLPTTPVGDIETLSERLRIEAATRGAPTPLPALVSAWSRVH
jgi:SAM-dependent methyltransferase